MDWVIIDVVIGLSFLFFLLSIVASAINEVIAGIFNLRAKTLRSGIANLLTGSSSTRSDNPDLGIVEKFFANDLVQGYASNGKAPSYLSSRSFRNVLLQMTDLLAATGHPGTATAQLSKIRDDITQGINSIQQDHLKASLMTIWLSVNQDADAFKVAVERWFDRGMERVSGWYKRRAQVILFLVGLVVAVTINASAIDAADRFLKDDGLRRGLIAQVENQGQTTSGKEALDQLEEMGFPIGWGAANRPDTAGGWGLAVFGWLLTALAVTLGAPFWFDVLGKVSNLRAAGVKPDSTLTPPKAEED